MALRVSLLGDIGIDGALDAVVLTRRDHVVLGALAVLGGEPVSTDALSDALWHDDPPASSAKVIQGSVMRLRKALGPTAIETTGSGYRFTLDGDTVDTHVFEGLVARARELRDVHEVDRAATTYEKALALWRGAPVPELADWDPGRAEAERLLEVRRAVEEELVEARLAAGRTTETVADAHRLVSREPHREHRWALYALALYRSGRQREALDALRTARRTLLDELGLDPGPELVELEGRILRQDETLLHVPSAPTAASLVCPYPGLRAFDAAHSELFVGREDLVATALERLDAFPLLVVVGPSGSGKSSFVRAGVVPQLSARGAQVTVLAPGVSPISALNTALASSPPPDVVVIDQLEELFTSPYAARADAMLDRLVGQIDDGRRVVVTLRADYIASLSEHASFARLAERGLLLITGMSEDQLRRAVEEPARRSGLRVEPGLVDLLVREVSDEVGGLPLLSHALAETWARRDGAVLTVEGYTSSGGIRGAVAQSAERLYDSLPSEDRSALRGVMQRLVAPAPSGEPVASRVPIRVFDGSTDAPRLLDLLVRARLVTMSTDWASVAHESLVRAWPRLRTWLDEDVEGQRILAHLQVTADGWDSAGRPDDELYRGARLSTAMEWRARVLPSLTATESAFLEASRDDQQMRTLAREMMLESQRRTNRNLRWALGGVAGLLVVALASGSLAAVNNRRAQDNATTAGLAAVDADAGRLAFAGLSESATDSSLLLARQAFELSDNPRVRSALLSLLTGDGVLASSRHDLVTSGLFRDSVVSPDGSRLLIDASVPDNGGDYITLVDTASGDVVTGAPLVGPVDYENLPYATGFIDGGRHVVVARSGVSRTGQRELVTFDSVTGAPVGNPVSVPGSVAGDFFEQDRLRISPDGSTLTSVLSRTLRVWHRQGGRWEGPSMYPLPGFPESSTDQDVAGETRFSDDGSRVLVRVQVQGPQPYVGVVMDTRTGRALAPAIVGGVDLSLSPDGSTVAVGYKNGAVELRSLSGPASPAVRIPGDSAVTALAWSSDGARLGVGDKEGGIAVYDAAPLTLVQRIPPSGAEAYALGLPDDGTVVSLDGVGRVTVSSLTGDSAALTSFGPGPVSHVSAGPAGTVVAAGYYGGQVRVFDQRTLKKIRDLSLGPYAPDSTFVPSLHQRVTAVAVTSDGAAVVAADRLGHLRMWSVADGRLLWSRDDVPTSWLALSPDGRYLATEEFSSEAGDTAPDGAPVSSRLRLWDLATRTAVMDDPLPGEVADDGLHTPKPRFVTFSPDSTLLAAGFFNPLEVLTVYDVAARARTATYEGPGVTVSSGAFTPDSGRLLVRDNDGVVRVLVPRTGQVESTYATHRSSYSALGFTADGSMLVYASDTTLDVVDATTKAPILLAVPNPVTNGDAAVAVTSDGYVFLTSDRGVLRLDVDPGRWKAKACAIADRPLTQEEWARYLPGRPYTPACVPAGATLAPSPTSST